jgi:hypothetical protein
MGQNNNLHSLAFSYSQDACDWLHLNNEKTKRTKNAKKENKKKSRTLCRRRKLELRGEARDKSR